MDVQIAVARRVGLGGVSLDARRMDAATRAQVRRAAGADGPAVSCLAHGVRTEPGASRAWAGEVDGLRAAIDAAAELGAPTVLITSGPSGVLDWGDAADRLVEHLAELVGYARSAGVVVALENTMPIRSSISFTHRVADAAEVAARLGAGVVVDLYCAWQERGLADTLARHRDRIALVQLADLRPGIVSVPNRWPLGDGALPLRRLLSTVAEAGIDRGYELELVGPAVDAVGIESALRTSLEWLRGNTDR